MAGLSNDLFVVTVLAYAIGMVAFAFVVVTVTMLLDRRFGRLTG